MKKIVRNLITFSITLLVVSCMKEDYTAEAPVVSPDSNAFAFRVHIPEAQIITARSEAIQPGTIDNLNVLVFDAEGTFLTRTQAIPAADPGKYTVPLAPTDPTVPENKKKRIVHFISNYDWSGFSDVHTIGKHENEVIAPLSVTGGKIAYWQRVELTNGISHNGFPTTVELVRNVAKISVLDNSIYNSTKPYLTETQFALGDYSDYGTIAPFSTTSLAFEENAVCESPYNTLQPVSESAFVEAGGNTYPGKSILCYERNNSQSKTPMYVIVKGLFSADKEYYYYKIDAIDEGGETLFDITRNYHYIIDIQEISGPGKSTLQEAVNSPASNNLLYSVLLEDYAAISDGNSALKVEMTSKTLVQGNEEFGISFSYVPDITTGREDNSLVSIELQQDPLMPVIDPSSQATGREEGRAFYTAKTVATVPEYGIYTARLVFTAISANSALRRTVSLRFRQPSVFGNAHTTPSRIPAATGETVALNFTVPSTIRAALFPLDIYITTLSLTPDLSYNDQDKLTLDYSKPGIYRYKYRVKESGEYTVHFKTTSVTTNEILTIESDLFTTTDVSLKNELPATPDSLLMNKILINKEC